MSSSITICGNLVRDPELRRTANGTPTTSLSVAVNRRIVSKGGTVTDTVSFFNVVAWNSLAEHVAGSLGKGTRVVVTGRLDQRTWEVEGERGETSRRTSFELVAEEIGASLRFNPVTVQRPIRAAPVIGRPVQVGVPPSIDQVQARPVSILTAVASSVGSSVDSAEPEVQTQSKASGW